MDLVAGVLRDVPFRLAELEETADRAPVVLSRPGAGTGLPQVVEVLAYVHCRDVLYGLACGYQKAPEDLCVVLDGLGLFPIHPEGRHVVVEDLDVHAVVYDQLRAFGSDVVVGQEHVQLYGDCGQVLFRDPACKF